MKLIKRELYLNKLINVIGTPDIKVITGIRRSGKSKLLASLKDYLIDNFTNLNIIEINFNLEEFDSLKECHKLYEYITNRYDSSKTNFVLIDEVQLCKDFETTINSLHAEEKYDIYITGSNAFLLSSDLATLFTGRTFEIKVYPFSFKEYVEYFGSNNIYESFNDYMQNGGMSGSYLYKDIESRYDYIKEVFDTLIVRDIKQRYKIRNVVLMDKLVYFLLDNVSNLTSIRNIEKTFAKNNEIVSNKTLSLYVQYLCEAFAFYKIRRYDVQRKKYLSSQDKYYLCDHSFRYAKLGTKNIDYGKMIENIVAIELLRRGYEIYVGTLYKKEIDFVALRRDKKIYIQVADNINDEKTFKRETSSLLQIKDNYPKMIITRTFHEKYDYEGIEIVDVANWLLNE
ncbi:MAG TPA: ATPase [Firmicutes bacterium]|nr:ATPase [Bacillota bacterium]